MPDNTFKILFLIGLILEEVIRYPHRMRNKHDIQQKRIADNRVTGTNFLLDMLAFTGMEIIPIIYIFATWLDFADYRLPAWAGWIGAAIFVVALWLLWRSHADLGRNWSPTLQIMKEHMLVTQGVYRTIRHPMYAAIWLMGIAQALMLWNWIAGLAALVCFLPVYLLRASREEQMMLDHFGEEYRSYMNRTGRVIPRLERQ
jgi:protein-S-isoprenylcysteine O-methyltransferase Ste14